MSCRASFILLCSFILAETNEIFGQQLAQVIAVRLCPYATFCNTNSTLELKGQKKDNLCCKRCSCEADCWRTESCCIDTNNKVEKPHVFNCKESLVKREYLDHIVYHGANNGVKRYRIIDYCTDAWKNSTLDDKCKAKQPTSLDEYVWVSDKTDGIIYQNKYCAECHGVENLVYWQIWAQCPDVIRTNFSSLFEQVSSNLCSLNVEAPSDFCHVVEPLTCFIYEYDKCNQTGLWRTFDADLLSGCIKFDSPVLYPRKNRYGLYKNVFCYLCNGGDPADFETTCPEILFTQKGLANKLSVLINLDMYSAVQDSGNENANAKDTTRCQLNEVFDMYMERCRQLVCPYGKTPIYGSCEQWTLETHGLSIKVGFSFEVQVYSDPSAIDANKQNHKPLAEKLLSEFKPAFGQKRMTCKTCTFSLYGAINNDTSIPIFSTFYLFATFYTNAKCQIDDLDNLSRRFVGNRWKVYITARDYVALLPDFELRQETEIGRLYQLMDEFRGIRACIPAIQFSSQLLCPAFDLHYLELTSIDQVEKKMILAAFFEAKQHKFGVIRVCLDEYFGFMSAKSSAAALTMSFTRYLSVVFIIIIFTQGSLN